MSGVWAILQKEVMDHARDRRALFSALIFPILGPVMLGVLVTWTGELLGAGVKENLRLPVMGAAHAPRLMAFLRAHRVDVVPAPQDPEKAVKAREEAVVLVISETFKDAFVASRPAPVELVFDEANRNVAHRVGRARQILGAYSAQIGALRLLARGVSPDVAQAVVVENIDVSTPEARAVFLLSILPLFVVLSIFVGGMHLAIDSTAGERERGSLEPLLIHPLGRSAFVLGKLGATWVFTVLTLGLMLVGFVIMAALIPDRTLTGLGIQIRLNAGVGLQIFVLALPLTVFGAALQMIVASFCQSFKEAQTYVSLIMMLPAVPALVLSMLPVKETAWMMMIPTLSEQLLILNVLRAGQLNPLYPWLAAGSTLLLSGGLVGVAIFLYRGERILGATAR